MKQFSPKRLSVLIGLAFAANTGHAEAPTPLLAQQPGWVQESSKLVAEELTLPPATVVVPDSTPGPLANAEAAALLTDGPGIPVGSFLLFPELTLKQTFDTNIFALPVNDISDWITTPSVSLTGRSTWSEHKVGFDVGADTNRYNSNSSQNVYDYWLGADGRFDFSPGNNIFGGLRFSRNHEERGTENTGLSVDPIVYYSTNAQAGTAFRNGQLVVRLGASAENLNYVSPTGLAAPGSQNQNDRDQLQYSFGARVGYEVSPAFMPFVQVSTDTRSYNESVDDFGFQRSSTGYRASIGSSYKLSPKFNGEAFFGTLSQSYDDARFDDVTKPYFGANLTWIPRPTTQVRALVDRSLNETTITNASSYLDTTVGISAEHAISQNVVANARFAYSWNDYQGISRSDKIADASAGFRYYIDPVVFVGADVRMINRDSNQQQADYSRSQLMFLLGYTPGRKRVRTGSSAGEEGFLSGLPGAGELHGYVMPKMAYFNNSGNSAYLNRYDFPEESFGSNARNGFIFDLDFSLTYGDEALNHMLLERAGFGQDNQRMRLEGNSRTAKLTGYYSVFTTATGTLGFLYNPDQVVGGTDPTYADPLLNPVGESQHVGKFNNDSPGTVDYQIKRTSYGGSALVRPEAFNERASVELGFDGYKRDGRQVANYVLDSFSLAGAAKLGRELNQWRGYAKQVDDQANRMTYNFSLSPWDDLLINYEFAVGKYQNKAPTTTFGTVAQWGAPSLQFDTGVVNLNTPLFFTPDSTLYSNSLRLSKQFGDTAAVSAGMAMSRLEQNTFSGPQNLFGYTDGRTDTDSLYVTGRVNPTQSIGLEAFVRYNRRENNSSYPVTGFFEPISSSFPDPRMVMPRINKLSNMTYGIEAKLYPSFLKTTWSAGWRHEDKERDLTYGVVPALAPPISLYGENYSADEIYLKMVARPARGWIVRVTPSYLWANETGLTATDPNEMFKLKTSVAYTKPDWNELAVTGYYNYTYKMNDSLSYSNYNLSPRGFASPQNQETSNTMQSFGVNMSLVPAEELKLTLGYDWNQNDFSAYYFSTNRLRADYPLNFPGLPNPNPAVPLDFVILDQTNYKVNNHTISAGIEKQWNRYVFMGSYSLNWAKGQTASGLAGQKLPTVDDKVDNLQHSFALGLEYSLKDNMSVRGVYSYDRNNDKVYDSLNGSRNTIWLGLNYRL
jgi:hypothetical protein